MCSKQISIYAPADITQHLKKHRDNGDPHSILEYQIRVFYMTLWDYDIMWCDSIIFYYLIYDKEKNFEFTAEN